MIHLRRLAPADHAAFALYEQCGFATYAREPQSVRRGAMLADELLMRIVLDKDGA